MKKFALLILLPVVFWGCEKTYDSVVNPKQNNNIKVINISTVDSGFVYYLTDDSVLTFALTFNSSDQIQSVYFNITTPAGLQLNSSSIIMYDDGDTTAHGDSSPGDNIFSNKFTMSNNYINGVYIVKYYVTDIYSNSISVAAQNFVFDNGKNQFAPVLSNLVLPDSVVLGQSFVFNVAASDSNGLSDIVLVYFQLYRPDSTLVTDGSGNSLFGMHDDGDPVFGDSTANDGIYSYQNSFSPSAQLGNWRFEFQAIDNSNLLSNKIIQNIKVTQ
jgi:hypothetical protein